MKKSTHKSLSLITLLSLLCCVDLDIKDEFSYKGLRGEESSATSKKNELFSKTFEKKKERFIELKKIHQHLPLVKHHKVLSSVEKEVNACYKKIDEVIAKSFIPFSDSEAKERLDEFTFLLNAYECELSKSLHFYLARAKVKLEKRKNKVHELLKKHEEYFPLKGNKKLEARKKTTENHYKEAERYIARLAPLSNQSLTSELLKSVDDSIKAYGDEFNKTSAFRLEKTQEEINEINRKRAGVPIFKEVQALEIKKKEVTRHRKAVQEYISTESFPAENRLKELFDAFFSSLRIYKLEFHRVLLSYLEKLQLAYDVATSLYGNTSELSFTFHSSDFFHYLNSKEEKKEILNRKKKAFLAMGSARNAVKEDLPNEPLVEKMQEARKATIYYVSVKTSMILTQLNREKESFLSIKELVGGEFYAKFAERIENLELKRAELDEFSKSAHWGDDFTERMNHHSDALIEYLFDAEVLKFEGVVQKMIAEIQKENLDARAKEELENKLKGLLTSGNAIEGRCKALVQIINKRLSKKIFPIFVKAYGLF